MSERLDSLRWTGAATPGIPRKATRFASPLGRGADVTADAAAAADVTSRGTDGTGPSEGPRGIENVSRSSGDGHDSGGARFGPSDRNDPTVEDDMSRGGASEDAQEPRTVVADGTRSQLESEPKSGGIEREITAGEGPATETESISRKGLTTGKVLTPGKLLTPGTVNTAGTVSLTPRKERKSAKAELQELGPALAGMRILVAEDTPILQVRESVGWLLVVLLFEKGVLDFYFVPSFCVILTRKIEVTAGAANQTPFADFCVKPTL